MGQEIASIVFDRNLVDATRPGFSSQQVDLLKKKFYDYAKQESSEITASQFATMLSLSEEISRPIFEQFDMDGNGTIDEYEFICSLAYFLKSDIQDRLEALFTVYDKNNSQLCEDKEFKDLIQAILCCDHQKRYESKGDDKVAELRKSFFPTGQGFPMELFTISAMTDPELRDCLLQVGLFGKDEIEVTYTDNDLTEELYKFDVANNRDETFENRKKGIETELPDEIAESKETGPNDPFRWKKTAASNAPVLKTIDADGEQSNTILALEYVHGYRANDTRNNVFYNSQGHLLYHAGQLGIQLDTSANKQRYVTGNQDDILCMDSFANLSATGDVGCNPVLSVWDNDTMRIKCNFNASYIKKGIGMVAFSHDGKQIAISCLDAEATILILDTEKFTYDNESLVLGAKSGVYFANEGSSGYKITAATGWSTELAEKEPGLCIGFIKSDVFVGAASGKLLQFKGSNLVATHQEHKGPITAICTRPNGKGIITGGSDGKVVIWSEEPRKLEVLEVGSLSQFSILDPKVRALQEDSLNKKIAIGTRSANIIEYDHETKKCVNPSNGHFNHSLSCISMVPGSDAFITCAEDFMIAKWSVTSKKLLKAERLVYKACSCDVSKTKSGALVAVGCKNGHVLIWDVEKLIALHSIEDRSKEITVLKFSPAGDKLAVGAADHRIRIYKVEGPTKFKLLSECKDHRAAVTHIDWSSNGQLIQSCSEDNEHLFFNPDTGASIANGASVYKDMEWETWTLTVGWPVIGIWPVTSNGKDIRSVCRGSKSKILVTSDSFGKVKLFKYPSITPYASYNNYSGHSSVVSEVRLSLDEKYLFSLGRNDKCIFQWRVTTLEEEQIRIKHQELLDAEFDSRKKQSLKACIADEQLKLIANEEGGEGGLFSEEVVGAGDQYSAFKPYEMELKQLKPTNFKLPPRSSDAPEGNLYLKTAFGLRTYDCKDTAKFIDASTVAFVTASLCVVMDLDTRRQSFFNLHEDDVLSLDVSKDRRFVATGSNPPKRTSKEAEIYVWDRNTKEELATLKGFHQISVSLLKFSPEGGLLLSFGRDKHNSLAVYDWTSERLVCATKVDSELVFDADWLDENKFATVGKKHIKFWEIKLSTATSIKGIWDKDEPESLMACKYIDKFLITGSAGGNLACWKSDFKKGPNVLAHNGPIYTLAAIPSRRTIYSGGKDGLVKSWKVSLDGTIESPLQLFNDLETNSGDRPSGEASAIRSLDVHPDGLLLVGLRTSQLHLVEEKTRSNEMICMNHYDGEVWGLACHPKQPLFVTCGGDCTIRIWNAIEGTITDKYDSPEDMRACDWSKDGSMIVVASVTRVLMLFDEGLNILSEYQSQLYKRKDQFVEDIKFNPSGTMIAYGVQGGTAPIEIVRIENKTLKPHLSISGGINDSLLHLDWSVDGAYLVLNSLRDEIRFVNIVSQEVVKSNNAKDIIWETWTSKFGYHVQGIFPGANSRDVNTVCRSKHQRVLATGDDFQNVNLFRYPSVLDPKSGMLTSGSKRYVGHSSNVQRVRFMMDDNCLVSVGGADKTILVWATDFGSHPKEAWRDFFDGMNIDFDRTETLTGVQPKIPRDHKGNVIVSSIKTNNLYEYKKTGFMMEEVDDGNELSKPEPWREAIKPPTVSASGGDYAMAPDISLTLDFCHGYRVKDKRNNLFYVNDGDLAYFAGGLGIVHKKPSKSPIPSQKFFDKHRDDCISMAVHPNKKVIATGELGPRPYIYIWDAATCQQIGIAKDALLRGVEHLAFSPDGGCLLAVCNDLEHKFVIFSTEDYRYLLFDTAPTAKTIFGVAWVTDSQFVFVGDQTFMLWTEHAPDQGYTFETAQLKPGEKLVSVKVASNKDILTGNNLGDLTIWRGLIQTKVVRAHSGVLDAIEVTSSFIFTGAKDCTIKLFNNNYEEIAGAAIDLYASIPTCFDAHIRALAFDEANNRLAVGVIAGEIYEFDLKDTQSKTGPVEIVKSHFSKTNQGNDEVHGLAIRDEDFFLTVGHDGTLREWSISKRKCYRALNLNIDENGMMLGPDPRTKGMRGCSRLRCIDIQPRKSTAAIGTEDGTIRFVSLGKDFKQVGMFRHTKFKINVIKYSPDGTKLAVGCEDTNILIYNVKGEVKLMSKIKQHNNAVTHLDWSKDNRYLHSNCKSFELLFLEAASGMQVDNGPIAFKDEEWATWNCVFGWQVQGIYRSNLDNPHINFVDRSNSSIVQKQAQESSSAEQYKLLAVTDERNHIRVYRYPCLRKDSACVQGLGHSDPPAAVKFTNSANYLFSVGGEDLTILQWKVIRN